MNVGGKGVEFFCEYGVERMKHFLKENVNLKCCKSS
jgi:hypothetical protein